MRSAFTRAGVALVTVGTFAAVVAGSSASAAPAFTPDVVAEALTFAATPDVSGTVPSGVCSASFMVRGGSGAGLSIGATSAPGQVTGSFTLSAGQSYLLQAGSSANGITGGLGGYAVGGNGRTVTSYLGYGGGAASGLLLGSTLVAVAGGGGGASNDWQGNAAGGSGGGGTGGAGGPGGLNNPALGGTVAPSGTAAGGNAPSADIYGGGGGGAGYSGGQGSASGLRGGGGSNYANTGVAGMNVTANGAYSAAAGGYSALAFVACPAPSAVTSVAVAPNGTTAEVSFPAAVDNGSPVTGYQYSINGGTNWNNFTSTGSTTRVGTISSLSLGTAYTVQIRPVYVTAAIVANSGGGVNAYGSATSQSFTTLAQNVYPAPTNFPVAALAQTAAPDQSGLLTGALALLCAGLALVGAGRRKMRSWL